MATNRFEDPGVSELHAALARIDRVPDPPDGLASPDGQEAVR